MSNLNRFFKGQMEDEELVEFIRPHWIKVLPYAVFILVMTFLELILLGMIVLRDPLANITFFHTVIFLFGIFGGGFLHYCFIRVFDHFFNIYIITNVRIIKIGKGLFHEDLQMVTLDQIGNIMEAPEGIAKKWLNYGEINLQVLQIPLVPDPEHYIEIIDRVKTMHKVEPLEDKEEKDHAKEKSQLEISTKPEQKDQNQKNIREPSTQHIEEQSRSDWIINENNNKK